MKYLLLLSIIAATSCSTPIEPQRRSDEQIESLMKHNRESWHRSDSTLKALIYEVGYLNGRYDANKERIATKCKCRCHQH